VTDNYKRRQEREWNMRSVDRNDLKDIISVEAATNLAPWLLTIKRSWHKHTADDLSLDLLT